MPKSLRLSRLSAVFLLTLGLPPLVIHAIDYCHQVSLSPSVNKRDCACFEVFSGVAEIAGGFRRLGEKSLTFDKDTKQYEDILSVHGFFQSIQHVMRLEQFGLLFLGVPCNSFSWMSSSQHQRGESNDYMGNTSYEWVDLMNAVAVRAAICIAIALSRKCYFMIENPRQSTLPHFPYYAYLLAVAKTLDRLAGNTGHRCVYWWMANYGHWCCKPSLSIANVPWLDALPDRAGTITREHQKQLKELQQKSGREVTKVIKTDLKKHVSGGKSLRDTSAYPRSFGDHVGLLHKGLMADPTKSSLQRVYLEKYVEMDKKELPQPDSALQWFVDGKLDTIKEFLMKEKAEGRFIPNPGLPGLDD